jgi:hypothetical protein
VGEKIVPGALAEVIAEALKCYRIVVVHVTAVLLSVSCWTKLII